ncbi:hypothetical protein Bca52824_086905 [Brassica carinata]|uniref:Uncharacterized protein n=1 Tax=Brassica carinata TaxID=52824 RepID=A0A8X7TME9_BRACI|nr:hypothetical protein Bca52824_086905 [Brassica carinata]
MANKRMDIPELPVELKESSLGVFIKFKEQGFGWASRLVHYMLGFKLDIKKKYEMWSRWSRTFEVFTVRV